jgi:magnesium transporter
MLWAYALYPDSSTEPLSDVETAAHAWAEKKALVWLDLEGFSREELERLGSAFNLRAENIDDCIEGEQRPRVDEYDNALFLIAYAMIAPEDPPRYAPRKVCFFIGERYLISVHAEPLRTIQPVRRHCSSHIRQTLDRGLDFLLYTIIDGMVDNLLLCAEYYEEKLDALEDRSLSSEIDPNVLDELALVRWDLIAFRRQMMSMREAIMPFSRGMYTHFSPGIESRFRHVVDHISVGLELSEGLREIMQGIRDNYHAHLAERTNSLMRTLTLFASIMMPLTLIAGFYGMNVVLWPNTDLPSTTWVITGGMIALAVGMYGYFRYRHYL